METVSTRLQDHEAISKFKSLVNDVNICMFTTVNQEHNVVSRPMSTATVDDEGNVWFFTNEFSEKVQEVSRDNIVNLIYSHPVKNIYLSVKGTCSLIIDRKKMEELWKPDMKSWFPEGLDDPKVCLVKVATETAWFWNHTTSKMGTLVHMIASITKGEKYKETEKGKLDLTPGSQEK
ncbi:MAG TPA: pyridoxamine 5'-phosphate oxidase family protein [Flavisolibacter sp.]|jgi:general stress protein 26|nr:pyridoxamine 5'-phosphate oxidase family protein [Flavisolibacter sp.]